MKYAVLTVRGFQMRDSQAATYQTQEEALKYAGPGDQVIPIESDYEFVEYKTGRKRLPTFNKVGR